MNPSDTVDGDTVDGDTVDLVALELPPAAVERLDAEPWVRPEAVARARAHLEEGEPTAEQLARSVVDCLVSERVR
jgi:hypothetical protein